MTLVTVDLRGGGRSTGDPAELSFDRLSADLEAIRTDLGVDRVAVLGHSILGVLAIEYGRRCPDTVSHVIAVGTPPRGNMRDMLAASTAFFESDASDERKRLLGLNMAALGPDASMRAMMLAQTPMRFCDPRYDAAPLFADGESRPALMQHLMGTLTAEWDVTTEANTLAVPILLAHGRYDYVVPHMLWEDPRRQLPTATHHLFEASGHQPFVEEPETFIEAVVDWMATSS